MRLMFALLAASSIALLAASFGRSSKTTDTDLAASGAGTSSAAPIGTLPYDVVESEDYDLAGRRRKSVKVILRDGDGGSERVRATLSDVARRQDADTVLVYAYRAGDDWQGPFTLGKLEWGRDGGGWVSNARLPAGGKFEAGKGLRPAGTAETVARETEAPPFKFKVVDHADCSQEGRKRLAIKVVMGAGLGGGEAGVRSVLLEAAKSVEADAVLVYGYRSGDDWHSSQPVGKLEYGRDGTGWSVGNPIGAEGKYVATSPHLPGITRTVISPPPPCAEPPSRRPERPAAGRIHYSLVNTLREAWRRDDMKHQPRALQIQAMALMQAVVRTDVSDPADREATLDYIASVIDSWE